MKIVIITLTFEGENFRRNVIDFSHVMFVALGISRAFSGGRVKNHLKLSQVHQTSIKSDGLSTDAFTLRCQILRPRLHV